MSTTLMAAPFPEVSVEGVPLNPVVADRLIMAEVQSNMFSPSQFRLVFRDPNTTVVDTAGFKVGVLVMIRAPVGVIPMPLFMGDVTAMEVDYGPEGNLTVVRGLDRSHRLMRGTQTMMFRDQMASDVVGQIVSEAEIPISENFEETTNVYPFLTRANVTAWVFVQQLAALENKVAYVDELGEFNFCRMPMPEEGPPPAMSLATPAMEATQLILKRNLLRLRATVTGAEQVPAAWVTGWDPDQAMPVFGMIATTPSTSDSTDPGALPPLVAGELGAEPFSEAGRPFDSDGAAQTRAEAIADELSSVLAELEGQCVGNPQVLAGRVVSLGMCGQPFDGQYVVTSARHVYDPHNGGYTTWFTVGGRQDRSLYALASGEGSVDASPARLPSVAPALVTVNDDPEHLGRVQVMFPWLNEVYQTAWARTVQTGASKEFGGMWLPEVGDEVLVAFDRGDIDHPYVIGNLYNGLNRPMPSPSIEGLVASRWLMSRMHHKIQFDDGPSALGITIETGTQTCSIKLDDEEQTVTIMGAVQVNIESGATMSLKAGADMSITVGGALSITAASITIEAEANLEANATGALMMAAEGEAMFSGEATVTLQGGETNVIADSQVTVVPRLVIG